MQQHLVERTPTTLSVSFPYEDGQDLATLDLATLVANCVREREQYRRTRHHDTRFGFELFRRALVERDEEAWAQLYCQYRGLVEYWAQRCSAFAQSEESSESITLAAFARFARVVRPERFGSFANLAMLLRYLRRCTESVVIDGLRAQRPTESLPDETILDESGLLQGVDDRSIERIERQEFWNAVMGQLHSEAERVVILRSFVLGMPPSTIYDHRRDLFGSISDVYAVKRNVLVRLRRSMQLQQLWA